jgi:hypothetical protein
VVVCRRDERKLVAQYPVLTTLNVLLPAVQSQTDDVQLSLVHVDQRTTYTVYTTTTIVKQADERWPRGPQSMALLPRKKIENEELKNE